MSCPSMRRLLFDVGLFRLMVAIRALNVWEKKKCDKKWVAAGSVPAPPDTEFLDQAGNKNKYFHYSI